MTKTKTRILIIGVSLAVAVLGIGGYLWFSFQRDQLGKTIAKSIAEGLMKPGPLAAVDTQRWSQLKVGMTKEEVRKLLGEAPATSVSSNASSRVEFWEWGYSYGFGTHKAHEKAFVIYFDPEGKVSSFRAPQKAEK
ncbi:MAG: outer membrane protein assembly factor BamE [Limisphaerales bacterium]